MKIYKLLFGCLCISFNLNAQNYRGSDVDRMNAQRYQQNSHQNSVTNTYQPNYGNSYGSSTYGGNSDNNSSYGNSYNNRNYNNSYGNGYNNQYCGSETVIQGAFNNNGQVGLCVLRYSGGKVTAFATTKTYTGQYDWQTMYPDNPHPTNSMQDGGWAESYSYKISVRGTNVYFNIGGSSGNHSGGYGSSSGTVLQGVFIYNNQQNLVVLNYSGGKITHYATSKNAVGNYDWQTMFPDNPHPTNSIQDGNLASVYKYKISIQGTTIYFNM